MEALALVGDARLTGLVLGPQSPPLSQEVRANVWTLAVGWQTASGRLALVLADRPLLLRAGRWAISARRPPPVEAKVQDWARERGRAA